MAAMPIESAEESHCVSVKKQRPEWGRGGMAGWARKIRIPPVMTRTEAPITRKVCAKTASPPVGLRESRRGRTSAGTSGTGRVVTGSFLHTRARDGGRKSGVAGNQADQGGAAGGRLRDNSGALGQQSA